MWVLFARKSILNVMMLFLETTGTLYPFWPLDKKMIIYIHISLSWLLHFLLKDPKGQICSFKGSFDLATFGFITLQENWAWKHI